MFWAEACRWRCAASMDTATAIEAGDRCQSPLKNAETLRAAISTSQLAVLPKLGHACVVEDPGACARVDRRFVKNAAESPGR